MPPLDSPRKQVLRFAAITSIVRDHLISWQDPTEVGQSYWATDPIGVAANLLVILVDAVPPMPLPIVAGAAVVRLPTVRSDQWHILPRNPDSRHGNEGGGEKHVAPGTS